MIYKKLCGILLLCITFNDAWATNLTNPTTSKGQNCVSVKTLDIKEVEPGLYNVDVEIIGHCIEKMNVKVCPSQSKSRCEFHVLASGERIKTQLNTKNEIPDVYYQWGFYEIAPTPTSQTRSPNWNFVEASYLSADIDGFNQGIKPEGYGVIGSVLLGDNVILNASYSTVSEDVVISGADADATLSLASAGIGYRYGATDTTDLFAMASYLYVELDGSIDGDSGSYDDNGYGLKLGIRSMLTESLEAIATIERAEIDSESETAIAVSAYYHFNKQLAIGVGYSAADDIDMYSGSLRLSF
ncbi:porin family protein [Shewanella sp. KX20019]|uniref:porin family protein n=1 Tax=Shewanella sp. KX20019 TaxID=2803864 RepID=UPI0019259D6E|nr:porin family protein [Shewanella sp. KX20019]QQX79654.1 porin family protein [Shewanella sp. KX20019]